MFKKRIVVCLDVRDGRTTKGVRFLENRDIGDPVAMAKHYYDSGADELVFYDITASAEKRKIMLGVVSRVANVIFIPFSVGGGIGSIEDMRAVLLAGAEKISVNSLAVRNPEIIREGADRFGSQCIVLGLDAKRDDTMPSGYRVYVEGGRTPTPLDVVEWAEEAQHLGAGEIVLNSIDADGTQTGYELPITKTLSVRLSVPVVASGGAGTPQHILEVLDTAHADAALIASMVHLGTFSIGEIKGHLHASGISVRRDYIR